MQEYRVRLTYKRAVASVTCSIWVALYVNRALYLLHGVDTYVMYRLAML